MVYTVLHIKKHRTMFAATVIAVVLSGMMLFHRPCNTYVFYDSGQADCFLVKTNSNRDILIDTGEYALGSPIAYYSGDFIDCIFLTHSHDDHIGGLEGILERFRVGVVFIPGCGGCEMEDVIRLCKQNDVPVKTLIAGDRLFMDEYEILVLNPFDKDYLSLNDTSLVLKLIYGDKSLLYTGDIEIPAEIDVLSSGFNMDSDLFKVPHHGAAGSAYAGFFDEVSPEIAVVSCGRNSFGHPSREVFGLLNGIPVYSTDRHGAVVIKGLKNGYRIKLCRTRTTVD
jgi:competence protein ComEC